MIKDKQLRYLICIYFVATVFTFALDWQLPGFSQLSEFSKNIDLDQYLIPDYMTYWQLTHYLTRVFLGYFCPKYWKIIFIIDFGWEALECYKWGAHNWYDLVWNMLGLITGMALRNYKVFDKFFNKSSNQNTLQDSITSNSKHKVLDVIKPIESSELSKPIESLNTNKSIQQDPILKSTMSNSPKITSVQEPIIYEQEAINQNNNLSTVLNQELPNSKDVNEQLNKLVKREKKRKHRKNKD